MTAQAKLEYIIKVPDKFTTVWNSAKPYQIWYGGRYSAKSWTKAIQYLCKAKAKQYFRGIFARDTQVSVRTSQYQLFYDICRKFECFHDQFDFKESDMKITCKATGNFLQGGSFEKPDKIKSTADPTDFWAEEPITRAAQIDRQDFFDITGSLRNSYGVPPIFHFTFNPISKTTWIYKDFFEAQAYDSEFLFVNYWDNPFCPQSGIDFLESLKILDPKRYKVDALGEWGVSYEGLIYPDFESVKEMPEVQFYGLDFGYNNPCALVAGAVADTPDQVKKDLFWQELLYETKHTSETLIKRFEQIGVKKNIKMICDNARPEMIADLCKAGYRAEGCHKYRGSVADGINEVKKYNLKIVAGSKNLFDEITTYCWKAKGEALLEEPEDSINHALDGGRYGVESIKVPPFEVTDRVRDIFAATNL